MSEPIEKATRDGFGEGLVLAAERDPRVVALCADLTESTRMNLFAEKFPERYIEVGVAEQNLVAIAAGLAAVGKMPCAASSATFSPGRNWEQIRTTICYNNRSVKIVGAHAGVSVGPDGATHQALEDIALMRALPNMTVVVPCDAIEAKKATLAVAGKEGPVYIRLARAKSPVFTTEEAPFEIGRANVLRAHDTPAVTIVACGSLVYEALKAADELRNADVIDLHTIKPIDRETILASVKKSGCVVTVEEHQVMGGMGSAVAELLAAEYPVPVEFVGMRDRFGESGEAGELLEHFQLPAPYIAEAAKMAISRK